MTHDVFRADWLETPVGRRCLAHEQRLVRRRLECVFGEYLLQFGGWGPADIFLRYARTQHRALVDWRADAGGADLVTDVEHLALADDSVDAVLLPHTLELTDKPQALLREASRVLRPEGHLIVLGFDPMSLWGLRALARRDGYPPGHAHLFREARLRDWLVLLSFEVEPARAYCHTLPFENVRRFAALPRERWARRWLPLLAGAYLLAAQKRVRPLTPIRPAWRERPRLRAVGGLEPTTRTSHRRERG